MEQFRSILLDVWREACKHIEISESTDNIAGMLIAQGVVEEVVVRRVDRDRGDLETVAIGPAVPGRPVEATRTKCGRDMVSRIEGWARATGIAHRHGKNSLGSDLALVAPNARGRDTLAGPLRSPKELSGILILFARPGVVFEARHIEMTQILLEPFSVALENDRRIREMDALREAAEADKVSLLNRLGRTEMGDVIIGADAGISSVMQRVDVVSRSDVPVLILGETGTGKELVARTIHRRSPRAEGPVIRVNCGAIPPELIDSQLFGYERGAFTGATQARKGWFERADGGTLFLDEIGELPIPAQVRLLRILQDGWMERVGGEHAIHVDVRIVAATHRDLAVMVAEKRFREDLWYRIAVFPILLPPLRDRLEDIPPLARHFAERAAIRFHLPVRMPTDEDIELLRAYSWPGNIRELGSVMDRAALLGDGERLEVPKALGFLAEEGHVIMEPETAVAHRSGDARRSEIVSLDEAMRRHIEAALRATYGRIEGPYGTARLLDINPHTLRARMRKLGIDWRRFRSARGDAPRP